MNVDFFVYLVVVFIGFFFVFRGFAQKLYQLMHKPNLKYACTRTLISLTCNKLVMGDMSNLTPIDVQLIRDGKTCSVNAMIRSFNNLRTLLKKQHESDIEYPIKALANQLDPVELQEWMDKSALMEEHAREIMCHPLSPFKKRADVLIEWLTTGCPTHSYSIMFDNAKNHLGDNIVFHCDSTKYIKHWAIMRKWLRAYIMKESGFHIVNYILPEEKSDETDETQNLNTGESNEDLDEVA